MNRETDKVLIIGAGIGGLSAAVSLATGGYSVTVLEKEEAPGGKMREAVFGDRRIDVGPTVFTMRWVFDELLEAAGRRLEEEISLTTASTLARHAWDSPDYLDLMADIDDSARAIGAFSGPADAEGYRRFCDRAGQIYRTLEDSFIRNSAPSPGGLVAMAGLRGFVDLWRISPFQTLWKSLGEYFRDPRLRQLFARYATYNGSSPFRAPATLMLIAHVEQSGLWLIDGGMHQLARALKRVAMACGATFRMGANVSEIVTDSEGVSGVLLQDGESLAGAAVVCNADVAAIANGVLGKAVSGAASRIPRQKRSLSAVTIAGIAEMEGFPLARHTVCFSRDYQREFQALKAGASITDDPTIYICAQDRDAGGQRTEEGPERIFCLLNAPANGDASSYSEKVQQQCQTVLEQRLAACGLTMKPAPTQTLMTTPADFHRLFPETGGALYGRASHGWNASFQRPTARTRIPGLYLAGGSAHPGAGVPMAALSGRMAADAIAMDFASIRKSTTMATSGGMSTR